MINLIGGNSFFLYFKWQAAYSWQEIELISLIGLCGIFSGLCSLIFYLVFTKLNYQNYSALVLFLLSVICCLMITFLGGMCVCIMTGILTDKFPLSFKDVIIFIMTCLMFGFFACVIFASIVVPVGIINGFWFMAMKAARLREQAATLNSPA